MKKNDVSDFYVGEYKDGKYHGQGTYIFSNGDKIVGEFRDGKAHGQGTFTSSKGKKYVGQFKKGEFHKGIMSWNDGDFSFSYNGEFKDGTLLGKAIVKRVNNINSKTWIYEGDFDNGIQINGTVSWEEPGFACKYEGEFKDNKMTGKGLTKKIPKTKNDIIMLYEGDYIDGSIVKGVWSATVNGLIEAKYEGGFKNGEFHGDGYFTTYLDDDGKYNKKGTKTHGKYVDGKLSTKTKISKFFSKFI